MPDKEKQYKTEWSFSFEKLGASLDEMVGSLTGDEELIEHTVGELIAQRVYALALGYEDVNDHDQLRYDPLLAVLVGKHDPLGQKRRSRRDRGKALAGKSTLNRLELTPADASPESRYKKIVAHEEQIESLFVDLLLQAHPSPPQRIVLDLDATDDPLYGHQEGRFFHGYYREYCYLPLYIFCGDFLLCAKLRTSDIDAAAGALDEVARIVTRIRQAWPDVRILLRGDSGFCREELMAWCEAHEVDFLFGLAKNERLKKILAPQMEEAKRTFEQTGEPAREFADFSAFVVADTTQVQPGETTTNFTLYCMCERGDVTDVGAEGVRSGPMSSIGS